MLDFNKAGGGFGISWITCKLFAPCCKHITMRALQHSILFVLSDASSTVSMQLKHVSEQN